MGAVPSRVAALKKGSVCTCHNIPVAKLKGSHFVSCSSGDGTMISGNFDPAGSLNGNGEWSASDGSQYLGNFKDGYFYGVGRYSWPDGSEFDGSFDTDCPQSGTFIDADGEKYHVAYDGITSIFDPNLQPMTTEYIKPEIRPTNTRSLTRQASFDPAAPPRDSKIVTRRRRMSTSDTKSATNSFLQEITQLRSEHSSRRRNVMSDEGEDDGRSSSSADLENAQVELRHVDVHGEDGLSSDDEQERPKALRKYSHSKASYELFDSMSDHSRVACFSKMRLRTFKDGEVIIHKGSVGTTMYFVDDGCVKAMVENDVAQTLCSGDLFGEIAFLATCRKFIKDKNGKPSGGKDQLRVCDVVASGDCKCWELSVMDFVSVVNEDIAGNARVLDILSKNVEERIERVDSLSPKPRFVQGFPVPVLGGGKLSSELPADMKSRKCKCHGIPIQMLSGWHRVEDETDESYEGDWQAGKLTGYGEWSSPTRGSYAGEWVEHQYHGKGKFRFPSGECYEGNFIRGCPTIGILNSAGGTRIQVQFNGQQSILDPGLAPVSMQPVTNGSATGNMNSVPPPKAVNAGRGPGCTCHGMPIMQLSGWHRVEEKEEVYEGDWQAGKLTGYGEWSSPTRGSYAGEWVEHQYHGKGKFRFPSGECYEGNFIRGCPTIGILNSAGGTRIQVQFNGQQSILDPGLAPVSMQPVSASSTPSPGSSQSANAGRGPGCTCHGMPIMQLSGWHRVEEKEEVYEGDWQAGKLTGYGEWSSPTRGSYAGEWADHLYHGKGKFTFTSGEIFQGEFNRGCPLFGTLMNAAGSVLQVQFNGQQSMFDPGLAPISMQPLRSQDDRSLASIPHGPPEDTDARCDCHGLSRGMLDGFHTVQTNDCTYYAGEWEKGQRHGNGKWVSKDYGIYRGYWNHGHMHGDGAFTWPEGHQFEGNFVDGCPQKGIITTSTGRLLSVEFEGTLPLLSPGLQPVKHKFIDNEDEHDEQQTGSEDADSPYDDDAAEAEGDERISRQQKDIRWSQVRNRDSKYEKCTCHALGIEELEGNHEVLYSNGRLYVGGWKDGLWSGRGMWRLKTGKQYIGFWSGGLFTAIMSFEGTDDETSERAKGKVEWRDGSYFEGIFSYGCPQSGHLWEEAPEGENCYEVEFELDPSWADTLKLGSLVFLKKKPIAGESKPARSKSPTQTIRTSPSASLRSTSSTVNDAEHYDSILENLANQMKHAGPLFSGSKDKLKR